MTHLFWPPSIFLFVATTRPECLSRFLLHENFQKSPRPSYWGTGRSQDSGKRPPYHWKREVNVGSWASDAVKDHDAKLETLLTRCRERGIKLNKRKIVLNNHAVHWLPPHCWRSKSGALQSQCNRQSDWANKRVGGQTDHRDDQLLSKFPARVIGRLSTIARVNQKGKWLLLVRHSSQGIWLHQGSCVGPTVTQILWTRQATSTAMRLPRAKVASDRFQFENKDYLADSRLLLWFIWGKLRLQDNFWSSHKEAEGPHCKIWNTGWNNGPQFAAEEFRVFAQAYRFKHKLHQSTLTSVQWQGRISSNSASQQNPASGKSERQWFLFGPAERSE